MSKFKVYTGIAAVAFFLFLGAMGIGSTFAGEDDVAKIQSRIAQLQEEILQNQEEYRGIAASIREDRARCELAAAKETQLARLSGANNAKRTELEILNTLLQDKNATVKLPKE